MNCIFEILLYRPRIYSGLDYLMVALAKKASQEGLQLICVYAESMDEVPLLREDIEEAGGKVELVSGDRNRMWRDIYSLYRAYHPIVVHTHFDKYAKLYTCICSFMFGAEHFTHMRSLLGGSPSVYKMQKGTIKRNVWKYYYRFLIRFSKKVFCVSDAIRNMYEQWSEAQCDNVETMYNGTRLLQPQYTQIEARSLLGLPLQTIIITNVSAIEYIKGIDIILYAVAKFKQRHVNLLFVHIGGLRSSTQEQQHYADNLRQIVRDLDIVDSVVWLGRRNDVQDILPFADIYIHPSRSEGLGSVLMEASVAGLPLVGTNVGGIPELVINNKTGILIDAPKDDSIVEIEKTATALVDGIIEALNNKSYYGLNAQRHVYTNFNQATQVQNIWKAYDIKCL